MWWSVLEWSVSEYSGMWWSIVKWRGVWWSIVDCSGVWWRDGVEWMVVENGGV